LPDKTKRNETKGKFVMDKIMSKSEPIGQSLIPITDVKVRLVNDGTDGLLAWASCVVSGAIKLDNIAIRRSRDGGLFLTYPTKRSAGGEKYHYFNPISKEAAQAVQDALLTQLVSLAKLSVQEGTQAT
jgi:DNA-binding cell septation regulator SpoVG